MKLASLSEQAMQLNRQDPLSGFRDRFHIPQREAKEVVYFTGNSLGLMPKNVPAYVNRELNDWATFGVEGHFQSKHPWLSYHELFPSLLAPIVGALDSEIVVMNQLTVNLHLLMVSFYRPTSSRHKILCEGRAFSSDQYAMESQVCFHGFDPQRSIVEIFPREGESYIRKQDLIEAIRLHGEELALVLLGGVNYYTGQLFDLREITREGQAHGAVVGFDLAHAAGNVSLQLHDWGVDFATWCSYKYLNSGPGGVSGVFIHERHHLSDLPRFEGWWGYRKADRFQMNKGFIPIPTAEAWQLSNAPVLSMAAHHAALSVFQEAGMDRLHAKRKQLSELMVAGLVELQALHSGKFEVLTPMEMSERGCQTSLYFSTGGKSVHTELEKAGFICDWREPGVIRLAPVPLYNLFSEVTDFICCLDKILKA
ncbi:MAG: kynureninase [Bacteroidetes bacterium]|nr:kynureninase [Bacteroidota bacterium]